MLNRVFQLKPLGDENNKLLHLKRGVNFVGRSKESAIQDIKCSKRQLQVEVDDNESKIKLKVLGVNPCGINGLMLMPNTECLIQPGDKLEVVYGKHSYELICKQEQEKNNLNDCWCSINNGQVLIFAGKGVKGSKKIAAYDLDGTIIKTKSGLVFPKTCDDWILNYNNVASKLRKFYENGFKICFFTNQGGVGKGKVNIDDFKRKIELIVDHLKIPVHVFIALHDDYYRKPCPGMWEYLENNANDGIEIERNKCFFVGDAAGRPEIGKGVNKRRKDHSAADRFFAKNINVPFFTPEEHFLDAKPENWTTPEFDPCKLDEDIPLLIPSDTKLSGNDCELVIMVGLPGSGKSHFCQHHLKPFNYTILNADTLGSVQTCIKKCQENLKDRKACVIDNTNVDELSRKKFIEIAKTHNIQIRCFLMNVTETQIKHNLAFRRLTDGKHSKINEMVLNTMKKKYTAPTKQEGFHEIVKINLKPIFNNNEYKRLYNLYLIDKY